MLDKTKVQNFPLDPADRWAQLVVKVSSGQVTPHRDGNLEDPFTINTTHRKVKSKDAKIQTLPIRCRHCGNEVQPDPWVPLGPGPTGCCNCCIKSINCIQWNQIKEAVRSRVDACLHPMERFKNKKAKVHMTQRRFGTPDNTRTFLERFKYSDGQKRRRNWVIMPFVFGSNKSM